MTNRFFRPMLWPTLMAVAGLAVLMGLGMWQLERLRWKETLIETVDTRTGLPPVSFPGVGEWNTLKTAEWAFRPVMVQGRFDHGRRQYWFTRKTGGPVGFQVITPLQVEGGNGGWVLVDRGFVAQNNRDPALWTLGEPEGLVSITGLAREAGRRGLFDPPDEPQNRLWFVRDNAAMAAALNLAPVAPLFVDAVRAADPAPGVAPVPEGGQTPRRFRNDHWQYALTWFGLAAVLASIYFAWHWQAGRIGSSRCVRRP